MAYVYLLSDPRDNTVVYIGSSTQSLQKRMRNHIYTSKKPVTQKDKWIAELVCNKLTPTVTILEDNLSEDKARRRELYWIRYYVQAKFVVLNSNSRGYALIW